MNEPPLGRLLGIAGRMTEARFHRLLESQGMTHAGLQVLLALAGTDGLTQREVAERCYVTPATVTGVVDTLEREGLVQRERGVDDRRVVRVSLTDEGRARLARTKRTAMTEMAPVFGDLTARDEAVVRRFLTRTIERLGGVSPFGIVASGVQDGGSQGGGGADSSAIGDDDNAASRRAGRRAADRRMGRHALGESER